jgi:predicted MPP superfamily phosphohydrolase
MLLGGGGVAADMALIEPHALRKIEVDVPLAGGAGREPLRLLHMSDFHASDCVSLEFIDRAVRLGLETAPDLICLTGDFISWRWSEWQAYADILKQLSAAAPTFAVLGNHDGGPWAASSRHRGYKTAGEVRELLSAAGIQLLHNASRRVEIRDWRLQMVGLGDLYNREVDAEQAFALATEPEATTIVLNHNPDAKALVADRP